VADSPLVAVSAAVWGARRLVTRVHGVRVEEQAGNAREAARTRREWGVPENAFLIGHVGNFRPEKNHALLLEAAARVVATEPRALFLLAGSGPLLEEVRARALGLDRVRVAGHVPAARRLVAALDLLILSSRHEGLPVVVMESLAAGVPVVSTAVGGVPDLVRHGHNGLLTPPGDEGALADAIRQAMRPDVHARLRRGAADSASLVDIGRTAAWFERLYEEVRR
jgi:glycosyltransferase involved in cell wall biosynthesis